MKDNAMTPMLLRTMTATHRSAYFQAAVPTPQPDLNTNDLLSVKLNTELMRRAANPLAQTIPAIEQPIIVNATANPQAKS